MTSELATPAEFDRLRFLLGAERVLAPAGNHLDLLSDSARIGRELTNDFYDEYQFLRRAVLSGLSAYNQTAPAKGLVAAAQKLLDRVLFVAFCEDRGLLPANIVGRAYEQSDPFNPRPIYENFRGLFRSVDVGDPVLGVEPTTAGCSSPTRSSTPSQCPTASA